MKIVVTSISNRKGGLSGPEGELVAFYLERSAKYTPCVHRSFISETKFLAFVDEASARTRPFVLLADSEGKSFTSMELAELVTAVFDAGTQMLVFAVGPADGWSAAARKRADKAFAFGRITLPHELAAVIAAEQLYRALTIRAGHPYHAGH